jgi:hypothetical protein
VRSGAARCGPDWRPCGGPAAAAAPTPRSAARGPEQRPARPAHEDRAVGPSPGARACPRTLPAHSVRLRSTRRAQRRLARSGPRGRQPASPGVGVGGLRTVRPPDGAFPPGGPPLLRGPPPRRLPAHAPAAAGGLFPSTARNAWFGGGRRPAAQAAAARPSGWSGSPTPRAAGRGPRAAAPGRVRTDRNASSRAGRQNQPSRASRAVRRARRRAARRRWVGLTPDSAGARMPLRREGGALGCQPGRANRGAGRRVARNGASTVPAEPCAPASGGRGKKRHRREAEAAYSREASLGPPPPPAAVRGLRDGRLPSFRPPSPPLQKWTPPQPHPGLAAPGPRARPGRLHDSAQPRGGRRGASGWSAGPAGPAGWTSVRREPASAVLRLRLRRTAGGGNGLRRRQRPTPAGSAGTQCRRGPVARPQRCGESGPARTLPGNLKAVSQSDGWPGRRDPARGAMARGAARTRSGGVAGARMLLRREGEARRWDISCASYQLRLIFQAAGRPDGPAKPRIEASHPGA